MSYGRTCELGRVAEMAPGVIGGTLATDGEAEDGHILNIAGGRMEPGSPLLFEHGRIRDFGPLGSWVSFDKVAGTRMGESKVIGQAKVELDGDGPWLAQRRDVFHMIDQKHIRGFSIRWDIDGESPVLRSSLPKSHIAHVPKTASGARRSGVYFPKWRMVEGSVAVVGKDQSAVIDRIQRCGDPELEQFWRSVMEFEDEIAEVAEQSDTADDYARILRDANAVLLRANERLSIALDLHEQMKERTEEFAAIRSEDECIQRDDSEETAAPETNRTVASLPTIETPRDMARMLREGLEAAAREVSQEARIAINAMRGKVTK